MAVAILPTRSLAAGAMPTVGEISRLVSADRLGISEAVSVVRWYGSLGLRVEAASFLEERMRLGEIPRPAALPLFDEIVTEQSRWDHGDRLVALCEIALRNGAGTESVWYAYGTGLRSSGRLRDSLAAFGRIEPESPLYPYAAFAIGQAAAEQGNDEAARDAFRRAGNLLEKSPASTASLGSRLLRSRAELLLATGSPSEALPLFETLARAEDDPLLRFASAVAKGGAAGGNQALSAESVARLPIRQQVLLLLLRAGLSAERGDFDAAAADLARADRSILDYVSFDSPPAYGVGREQEEIDSLNRQIAIHASLRQTLRERAESGDAAGMRDAATELLLSLLLLDRSVSRTSEAMPGSRVPDRPTPVASPEADEILRRIENAALDGSDVEGLVRGLGKRLDVLENLAHPIRRYRLLARLEKLQSEIVRRKDSIRERRPPLPGGDDRGDGGLSDLLGNVGRFLGELAALREGKAEAQEYLDRDFDIFGLGMGKGPASLESARERVSETLEFDARRFADLLSRIRGLQDRARAASFARQKEKMLSLRPAVARRLADALVGRARPFRGIPRSKWPEPVRAALEGAVSLLGGGTLTPGDRTEVAVNIASLILHEAEGREGARGLRGENEREMVDALLSALGGSVVEGRRREEALYLAAVLRMERGDKAGASDARDFLKRFPGTPRTDDLAVRLGHEAFRSGNVREAESLYRTAADGPNGGASLIARYMLGWALLQDGDSEGALREVALPLSSPSFGCKSPSPAEEALVALALRSLEGSSPETVLSYFPVRQGTCAGKILLGDLGRRYEDRSDAARATPLYAALAERYPGDEDVLTYEGKAIRGLAVTGKNDQAIERALLLGDKYGPDSGWARSLPQPSRGNALEEILGILTELAERTFDAGIRSGESAAMKGAADLLERLFSLGKDDPDSGDRELRLKWAVASLRSGAEEKGVELLDELLRGEHDDSVAEKAALLVTEAMLSGYERGTRTVDDAMNASDRFLRGFPSAKAARTALRASAAFLKCGDYGHARRLAAGVEESGYGGRPVVLEARLVRSEAAIFLNDFGAARDLANSILGDPAGSVPPMLLSRAKDLSLLSALKEIEAREAAEEWRNGAALLEEIGRRFADKPETPLYLHRAVKAYRVAGDNEGALRAGLLFLERFPGRDEALEIAGIVGAFLEEGKKSGEAAEVYAAAADRHQKNDTASDFLFRAACLSQDRGDRELARKRFLQYRARYSNPPWRTAYATLSLGLLSWMNGDGKTAFRELSAGLKRLEAGVEPGADPRLFDLAARANVAIGEYWADRFRKTKLVLPLDRSLAAKGRLFRKSLAAFEQAEKDTSTAVAVKASQLSGDLFVDFGDSLLSSQRPKGMNREEQATYEEGLRSRADVFFERALDRYAAALKRVEEDAGPGEFAAPVRRKIERTKKRFAENSGWGEARK